MRLQFPVETSLVKSDQRLVKHKCTACKTEFWTPVDIKTGFFLVK